MSLLRCLAFFQALYRSRVTQSTTISQAATYNNTHPISPVILSPSPLRHYTIHCISGEPVTCYLHKKEWILHHYPENPFRPVILYTILPLFFHNCTYCSRKTANVWLPISNAKAKDQAVTCNQPHSYANMLLWAMCCTGFLGFLRCAVFLTPGDAPFDLQVQ